MNRIEITFIDDWPRIRMVLSTDRVSRTEIALFDVALTNFEVPVKNALRQALETIINRRKRST